MHLLVFVGLLFLVSQAGGRLAKAANVPSMIGFLVSGIIFGPSVLGIFPENIIAEDLNIITEIALALIAFSIGGSLRIAELKSLKWAILIITFLQAFAASALVFILMSFLLPVVITTNEVTGGYVHGYLPIALVIGAISAATAPAAIMSIVREYRARGPFTSVLLGVIALDDALTVMFFGFAISMGKSLVGGEAISLYNAFIYPLRTIFFEMALGAIIGFAAGKAMAFFHSRDILLGFIVGTIFLTSGLAISFGLSPILSTMMLGFVLLNLVEQEKVAEIFSVLENIESPIFGIFFALAGAHLQLDAVVKASWLILILTSGRFAGKLLGTALGARITSAPQHVKRYLGIALLPAAGVTIGLMLEANAMYYSVHPKLCETMVSAVVGATLINELLTPFLVRYSLFHAGEAQRE